MKIYIDPTLSSRIREAWDNLSPAQRARIAPILQRGHRALVVALGQKTPVADASIGAPVTLALSALNGDTDGVIQNLDAGVVVSVDGGGEIWGTGKYEQLDPGWLEALAEWLEHLVIGRHPFPTNAQVIQIPDTVQIALAGDWGTGDWRTKANPSPSGKVRDHIAFLHPDLTIHLGDVYYSGTSPEEQHILTKTWPPGLIGSLALNSNHEMYSGGSAYFQALGTAPFILQKQCSYFALENTNWVIVGLDSAYFADEDTLYRDGALFCGDKGTEQMAFLKEQIAKNKKVVILTHHNALTDAGSNTNLLWAQVMSASSETPAF